MISMDLDWNEETWSTIQIQNPILNMDCQSQSNPPNWFAFRIEQSSNPIQQYPGDTQLHKNVRMLEEF